MKVYLVVLFTISVVYSAKEKCVKLPEMCRKLSSSKYKSMRLPNMLNHTSSKSVESDINAWKPLLSSSECNAGDQLNYFLCFVYAPVCVDTLISPCKSLCETVRDSCDPVMKKNSNYSWPAYFNCNEKKRFPEDSSLMCINMTMLENEVTCSCNGSYDDKTLETFIRRSDFVWSAWVTRFFKDKKQIRVNISRTFHESQKFVSNTRKDLIRTLHVSFIKKSCRCNKLRVKKKAQGKGRYLIIGQIIRGKLRVKAMKPMKNRKKIQQMVKKLASRKG